MEDRGSYLNAKIREGLSEVGKRGTAEQLVDFYDENAEEYNEMLAVVEYSELGAHALAQVVAKFQPNKDGRILDCAAGAGHGGMQLYKLGYQNIDALDPSEGMLQLARSRNVYKNIIVDRIHQDKSNSVKDATYDAICIFASMMNGHITLDHIPEITRMLKKGGTLTFNIPDKYLKSDPDFQDEVIERKFQAYVDDGQWKQWQVQRGVYRKDEDCNMYTIFI